MGVIAQILHSTLAGMAYITPKPQTSGWLDSFLMVHSQILLFPSLKHVTTLFTTQHFEYGNHAMHHITKKLLVRDATFLFSVESKDVF